MNYVLSAVVFCLALTGCSQKAGGDISTNTEISPTTNFQLDSDFKRQGISDGGSDNNERNNLQEGF